MNTTTNVTTLRILTRKSRLGFGKHGDMTIQDILIRDPAYIPWAYYCLPAISFTEDILEECGITDRIAKPGKDPEKHMAYMKERTEQFSREERNHHFWKKNRTQKKIAKAKQVRESHAHQLTKGMLQAINHGKM